MREPSPGPAMSRDDEWHGELRRVFPAPRRRPNPIVVVYRWRYELAIVAGLLACWKIAGDPLTGIVAGMVVVGAGAAGATVAEVREIMLSAAQHVIVPHRLRTGFVQAGTVSRDGRLPWITRTRRRARDGVAVTLWLPAGITQEDLHAARHVLAAACGASEVNVALGTARRDRVVLVVVRPRWGVPGW